MQSALFFAYKIETQGKCLDFCVKKRHVTRSVMLFVYKCQFERFHEKL